MKIIPKPFEETYFEGSFAYDLKKGEAQISFIKNEELPEEGYRLKVSKDKIEVESATEKGKFYAVQTLSQLGDFILNEKTAQIPCCEITDFPRFGWRGFMLDVSRHFFGVDEVKRLLDIMAMNKLNVFHWHLTDDQGWRIEIKKYPLLTEIASKRKDTTVGGWRSSELEGKPHEGFYTQKEIKDVVAYAKALNIEIMPEIDMPAHFRAVFAAYPDLACEDKPSEVPWYFGAPKGIPSSAEDVKRIACAGKEGTYKFIFDVIDEVCGLFPYPYFSIGGDEAPKDEWKKCPHCQKAIKDNNLKDEEELQGFFNNRVAEYLSKKGKRLVGWNEILKASNLRNDTVAQYWTPQRDERAENWANKGNDIIMSKHQGCYFDMSYAQYPLSNTYKFEPDLDGITFDGAKHILGCEGHVWTEFIDGREKLDLNTFPRMQALAEVCWCYKFTKNFRDFLKRWETQKPAYEKMGVNFAKNKIAQPKNPIRRLIDQATWYAKDQYFEVRRNRP